MAAPPPRDPHRIVHAEFIAGAGPGGILPPPTIAEVAFAGRSNVGKSSLINALVDRKNLVRTSSTPGSTRQLNFYETRAADETVFQLVDLPGYGFTKRSKAETASWASLIESYLTTRVTLGAIVLLADVRRGFEVEDEELVRFVEEASGASRRPPKLLFVATKIDKVSKSDRFGALARLVKADPAHARRWLGFSAVTGEGKAELWSAIRKGVLGVLDAAVNQDD
jgi:GTP-binding protein